MTPASQLDVLVVGAGPTGLTLACQLARFGVRFRIIVKQTDRARESRALGVQAMSLEVLQALGLGEALAARGRTTTVPRPSAGGDDTVSTQQLSLAELQAMIDDPTGGVVRVHDPAWLTRFRLSSPRVRAFAFHFVSQLGIRYRKSQVVAEVEPRLSKGPHAGDRLPDAQVLRDGQSAYLQQVLGSPHLHLLLCGPVPAWSKADVMKLAEGFPCVLAINYLTREHSDPESVKQRVSIEAPACDYRVEHLRVLICQSSENSVWV